MIKALPEDVEDPGSNLVCLIQTRNLKPCLSEPQQVVHLLVQEANPSCIKGYFFFIFFFVQNKTMPIVTIWIDSSLAFRRQL